MRKKLHEGGVWIRERAVRCLGSVRKEYEVGSVKLKCQICLRVRGKREEILQEEGKNIMKRKMRGKRRTLKCRGGKEREKEEEEK